jgi:hypothetical protein
MNMFRCGYNISLNSKKIQIIITHLLVSMHEKKKIALEIRSVVVSKARIPLQS